MNETADVIRFKAGDRVPDWLFVLEPAGPESTPPDLRFGVDCIVYDTDDLIAVVPNESSSNDVFVAVAGGNVNMFSEAKLVRVAVAQRYFSPKYPIPPGKIPLEIKNEKPSAWWRRFWPF